jgi:acetyl esterase/lipase
VYTDLLNSINNHRTSNIAIVGYSRGGGSTFALTQRIVDRQATDIEQAFDIVLTGYIDAIRDAGVNPEARRPLLSQYHVNFYQRNSWHLYGIATNLAPAVGPTENHHIDPNGNRINHHNIDDDSFVLQTLDNRLKTRIPFANR